MVNIFNPEHDLCLANGDPNYVPPVSAVKFGIDCQEVVRIIGGNDPVVAWGWDSVLKRRLVKSGCSEESLPSDAYIDVVKELSHRKYALEASVFVRENFSSVGYLAESGAEELFSIEDVYSFLDRNESAVLKAPWSGSGKGLRWIKRYDITDSDTGWCRKVISAQGSVMAERRQEVVRDFAALFNITDTRVVFEGLSLFYTDNGAYRGNILASDEYILETLSDFVPSALIMECVECLKVFLERKFLGKYKGFAGVDMFICMTSGRYFLSPCVEINVRMTMGLLARRYYDNCFVCEHSGRDGEFVLEVVNAPDSALLVSKLSSAKTLLTTLRHDSLYAIAVFDQRSSVSNHFLRLQTAGSDCV